MVGIFNFTIRCNVEQTLIKALSETSCCLGFGNYRFTLLLVAIIIFIYTKEEIFSLLKFESSVLYMKQAKDGL